ncbi:hypothetical protein H8S95_14255 [Pontibacter sp. KCTC 32443]|uniref:hypothetical protein n=1 Tax=Pontibacter TaxID=323449 RepID=UPI00164ECF25|nr:MULTISPECIES: hypothetical protein [Pontibacter]MBC5775238.1 hypothetical protein [Pontibacter sp. KCTC 32443]
MPRSLTDTILSRAGKLYLQLRLRNIEKIERELSIKYEGQYRNAGVMLLFDILMALAVVAVVGLVAVLLYFTTV